MNTKELPTASPVQRSTIHSTAELSCGDRIEAAYRGTVTHRGQVNQITPGHELFWIADDLSGSRRLLDVTAFNITRI